MWSDEFDKKINDAADNHLPPFQEEDWSKMNTLLNKHLPEEKRKNRFIPLLLLLGGFSMLVILTTYKIAPVDRNNLSANERISVYSATQAETTKEATITDTKIAEQGSQDLANNSMNNLQTTRHSVSKAPKLPVSSASSGNNQRNVETTVVAPEVSADPGNQLMTTTQSGVAITPSDNSSSDSQQMITRDTSTTIADENKEEQIAKQDSAANEKKTPSGKGSKWQISFSTGPDLSVVGMSKSGNWKMQYGVGIGYSISERVQLRTGFMISRKLYYADSSDYNPPKGFWAYYPNLQKIDANCLVYEIPLNVVYTFPSAKKHQWFVSGGLSSYLMKQETYEYYYKDPSGQDLYRERTINNENDHILSILHLSGGYQYKFNGKLSLMVEPYTKLPLGGVGFGKVKLNNTGVLFTVGYKPFAKKGK